MDNQPEFDFSAEVDPVEAELQARWKKNEAAFREGEGSEISYLLAWMFQCDGRHWRHWFDQEPRFRQEMYLNTYRSERDWANICTCRMRPYDLCVPSQETIDQEAAIVRSWAAEIRQAAIHRKPVPFRESEDMSGIERLFFRIRLQSAFLEAGVVIIAAAQD